MDRNLIYAKTPIGDEAVRQSTRVVQRNLRMVLVQVDGKLSVAELGAKIGDARMVENALRELEEGGYIAPALEAVSVWQESRLRVERLKASAASGLSSFVTRTGAVGDVRRSSGAASSFSTVDPPRLSPGRGNGDADDSAAERDGAFRRRSPLLLLMSGLLVVLLIAIAVALLAPAAPPVEPPAPAAEDPRRDVFATIGRSRLTQREAEVVALVLRGHSSEAIGAALGIAPGTVKIHRKNIYAKLGIGSQAELFSMFMSARTGAAADHLRRNDRRG